MHKIIHIILIMFILTTFSGFLGCSSKPPIKKQVVKKETQPEPKKYDDPRFEILRKKILENPRDANAYAQMGYLYGLHGDVVQELYYYTKALDLKTDFKEVHYNMACIYAIRGEKEKAIKSLEQAIIHGFKSMKTIEADKDLEGIKKEKGYQELLEKYFPRQ